MAYADLATKKTMARLSATLNESASDASHMKKSSFARRQLEKMGWSEGTGLGKNRDGMVSHIRAKKREESMGLGGEKKVVQEQQDEWWKDNVGSTLARLQQQTKQKKKAKKKKKKKKRQEDDFGESSKKHKIYSDQELFFATGGARFGMRAQRRAEGKWSRTESGSKLWEEEAEARKNIEWNGLGAAKVLLKNDSGISDSYADRSGSSSSTADVTLERTCTIREITKAEEGTEENDKKEKGSEKKKRKRHKKETKKEKRRRSRKSD